MFLADCLVAICPNCEERKELLQLLSGNTFGEELWSDSKREAPMLPRFSPVQKCPSCGHYYFMDRIKTEQGDCESFETGWLSFEDAIEASKSFHQLSIDDTRILVLMVVWAYNDIVRLGNEPTKEQHETLKDYLSPKLRFPGLFEDELIVAELRREIGEYEECLNLLNDYHTSDTFTLEIIKEIRNRAMACDNKVFKIQQ